jgi:hypothetical protein
MDPHLHSAARGVLLVAVAVEVPLSRMERLRILDPRRTMAGSSEQARTLHRGPDSRTFGTTPEETVGPPWHHRDPWSTLASSWSMRVAATRNRDSLLAAKLQKTRCRHRGGWVTDSPRIGETPVEAKPRVERCCHRGSTAFTLRPSQTLDRVARQSPGSPAHCAGCSAAP